MKQLFDGFTNREVMCMGFSILCISMFIFIFIYAQNMTSIKPNELNKQLLYHPDGSVWFVDHVGGPYYKLVKAR